jgi:hypothetical protein
VKKAALLTYLLPFIFVVSCSDGFPPEFPAPEFSIKSPLTGNEVSLDSVKGRPVVIYWFASW